MEVRPRDILGDLPPDPLAPLENVRVSVFLLLALGSIQIAACAQSGSEPEGEGLITRELFTETFFQLRVAALLDPYHEITVQARDRVLQELGVTQEDLLRFAEVMGNDPVYMERIWDEVEARLVQPDAGGLPPPDEEELGGAGYVR